MRSKITVRIPDNLDRAVREKLQQSNYNSMSDLVRELLRKWVKEVPIEVRFDD